MNAMLFSNKLSWALIILFVLSILTSLCIAGNNQQCNWVAVNQESFAEILTMIDSRVEENYDRIKTWRGKVNMVFRNAYKGEQVKRLYEQMLVDKPLPNEIIDHVDLEREFAVDVNKGLLYESTYPDAQRHIIDTQTNENLKLNELVHMGSGSKILTPDYHISCKKLRNRDGIVVGRKAIKQKRPAGRRTCQTNLPPIFDPRDTIRIFGDIKEETFAPLGGTFAKYLNFFDKNPLLDGHPTITVEECVLGDIKKYRITLIVLEKDGDGKTVHLFDKLVCSSEVGFNVVSYSYADASGKILKEKTFEYDLFNGVYLPVQKIDLSFDYSTGNLKTQRTVTFFNEKVNEPISEDVFTYKNLGLKNGDKFIDEILDREFTYQDGELIPTSSGSSRIFKQVNPTADLNGDSRVDWENLIILASRWLESSQG